APRIHSELLKLGIKISEASVSKYMVRHSKPPSQTWRTFLRNHATQLVSIDFFTVPTALFQVLFVFIVIHHDRRRLVHFNVTAHPTADGRHGRSWKLFHSKAHRSICCAIATGSMARYFAYRSLS